MYTNLSRIPRPFLSNYIRLTPFIQSIFHSIFLYLECVILGAAGGKAFALGRQVREEHLPNGVQHCQRSSRVVVVAPMT